MEPLVIKPNKRKVITLDIICSTLAGIIFYALIYFIISSTKTEIEYLNILLVLLIFVIIAVRLILHICEFAHLNYTFYETEVIKTGKTPEKMPYNKITRISSKKNFLDKVFGTHTIILSPGFKIKDVDNDNQVYFAIQKLIKID